MAERVTFIHAADLHLGAPFKGLHMVSEEWGKRLVDAVPQAYDRLIDAALEHDVDFVVLAGDIFDQDRPSYGDFWRFVSGIRRLDEAGIPVYFCTGNHDPYTQWQRDYAAMPPNAHLFGAGDEGGFFRYDRDGRPLVLLAGRGYYHQVWTQGQDIAQGITRQEAQARLGQAPFAVGVLHTGLDVDPTKAPVSPAELLKAGMDYWALGHIHTPYLDDPSNPRIAFSGCIQGRKPRDAGPRGVNLVTLEQGKPNKVDFIPTASVVWQRFVLDISECATLADVSALAVEHLLRLNGESSCDYMMERITLTGTTPLHATLQLPGVMEDLRLQINREYPQFYCDTLRNDTHAPLDREKLLAEGLFPAVFLRTSQGLAANRAGEIAYLQQEFIDRGIGISNVSERVLARMEDKAETLVLDLLAQERGAV